MHPEGITVYNFRVAEAHTYFVRGNDSTAEPVWVHNAENYIDDVAEPVNPRADIEELASEAQSLPRDARPKVVARLVTKDGNVYEGQSAFKGDFHPDYQNALDRTLPVEEESPFNGRCAEGDCINQALNAGDDLRDATIQTARVHGINSEASAFNGDPIVPCETCEPILNHFGVEYIE